MSSTDITEDGTDRRVDETTALLAPEAKQSTTHASVDEAQISNDDRPLPRTQVFLICFARFIEPTAFFCIFPFVNQMIWETGQVAETDVGFWSGLIVCPSYVLLDDDADPRFRSLCSH